MKKTASVDIRNLFQKFGGDAEKYQEIQQDYVVGKALQSWPIVSAIEKAQVNAPTLKSSAKHRSPVPTPDREPSEIAHKAASPAVSSPLMPAPAVRTLFGSLGAPVTSESLKTAPVENSTPARSLFSALNNPGAAKAQPVRSASAAPVTAAPVSGLFNRQMPSQPESAQVTPDTRPGSDALNSVFSRLLEPQGVANAPAHDLRTLFGFLNKQ